ncbi:MAG: AraC family transcriptional regulator ligand-binding domain-containing protein [Myxococcota bacterium]
MNQPSPPLVHVGKAWRLALHDLGLDRRAILRRAGLSPATFDGEGTRIPVDDVYRLWAIVTEEANEPELALKLGLIANTEHFDPAFFAAMCSPDMNTAARRLADFKRVVGAWRLDVDVTDRGTTIGFRSKHRPDVPSTMGLAELVFQVAFIRRATRRHVRPLAVAAPHGLSDTSAYDVWFGVPLGEAALPSVIFSREDAARPFLTHDDGMWATFEPSLRRRMADTESGATTRQRVEQALLELLPSGRTSMEDMARELAMSHRTLQRRLADEQTTWVEVLNDTRERLARHYLASTAMSPAEVSFLLGFQDPNSLFRAFHRWTSSTPEVWRANHGGRARPSP